MVPCGRDHRATGVPSRVRNGTQVPDFAAGSVEAIKMRGVTEIVGHERDLAMPRHEGMHKSEHDGKGQAGRQMRPLPLSMHSGLTID